MARSQNGWPVAGREQQDEAPLIRTIRVPNGVLKGDVAVVFRWLARQYDSRVEQLVPGTCWGWFVKRIVGSSSYSNHSSGCAVDFNADRHPMGQAASRSMTAKQIAACRAIVREAGGVLRWGGDYEGRVDSMHWEIVATPARVKAFANKIRDEEADVPTADQISAEIIKDVRKTREFLSDTNVDIIAKQTAAKLTPVLNQLLAMARGEAAEVPPSVDEIKAAVREAVGDLPTAQEKAALLAPLLGDDAAEVGRILAGV